MSRPYFDEDVPELGVPCDFVLDGGDNIPEVQDVTGRDDGDFVLSVGSHRHCGGEEGRVGSKTIHQADLQVDELWRDV